MGMVPGWKSSPQGKVPKDFSNEELNEGMTSSVARMSAIVLKKRVVGYGNRVGGSNDIGQKLDYLSKQISAVGGIALVGCSLSGEGLLSKGAIFTSLFSSNEPEFDDLYALFEDLWWKQTLLLKNELEDKGWSEGDPQKSLKHHS